MWVTLINQFYFHPSGSEDLCCVSDSTGCSHSRNLPVLMSHVSLHAELRGSLLAGDAQLSPQLAQHSPWGHCRVDGDEGTGRASCDSAEEGLWLDGEGEAGATGKLRSKERSALPRLTLRLLGSFSCVSAANCSKYLYLKVKFQRVSVKRKRSPVAELVYGRNTCRVSWFPDAWSREHRADWRLSVPGAQAKPRC